MTIKSAATETDPTKENYGLPTNGLSFTEIENEFGQASNRSLGQYRINKVYGAHNQGGGSGSNGLSFPLSTNAGPSANSNIPTSGTIKFSDFYNGKLTCLIDGFTVTGGGVGSNKYYHNSTINAKSMWNSGNRIRIGEDNIPSPPPSFNANNPRAKVILYINKVFAGRPSGSTYNSKKYVTVKTGGWTSRTDLHILVGNKGRILGSGGKGGNAGDGNANGTDGFNGMSAVGANNDVTITIKNGGVIRKGFGGGGGGGGYYTSSKWSTTTQQGGGGGGGAGWTINNNGAPGGSGHSGSGGTGSSGKNGGGAGRSGDKSAGDGADGADENAPSPGSAGAGNQTAGSNGANGDAFRKTSGGIAVNIFPSAGANVDDTSVQTGQALQ
mgnify:CR=1 FL=1